MLRARKKMEKQQQQRTTQWSADHVGLLWNRIQNSLIIHIGAASLCNTHHDINMWHNFFNSQKVKHRITHTHTMTIYLTIYNLPTAISYAMAMHIVIFTVFVYGCWKSREQNINESWLFSLPYTLSATAQKFDVSIVVCFGQVASLRFAMNERRRKFSRSYLREKRQRLIEFTISIESTTRSTTNYHCKAPNMIWLGVKKSWIILPIQKKIESNNVEQCRKTSKSPLQSWWKQYWLWCFTHQHATKILRSFGLSALVLSVFFFTSVYAVYIHVYRYLFYSRPITNTVIGHAFTAQIAWNWERLQ